MSAESGPVGYDTSCQVPPSAVVRQYVDTRQSSYFSQRRFALDVGCGRGRNALYMAKYGFEVTGVDINSEDLRLGEQRLLAMGLGAQACHFVEADIRELPNFARSFDVVAANEVLNNFPKPEQYDVLREIQQRTKIQGIHLVSGYLVTPEVREEQNRDQMLNPGELRRFYEMTGWHIQSYMEDEPKVYRRQGKEYVETKAHLIAKSQRFK
jgi:tellurite methyltransferase